MANREKISKEKRLEVKTNIADIESQAEENVMKFLSTVYSQSVETERQKKAHRMECSFIYYGPLPLTLPMGVILF